MSAAVRARMRLKEAEGRSHFEESLQELKTAKKGAAGRSANVQQLLDDEDESDLFKEVQILRKASLTQEQWEKYLSLEKEPKQEDSTETTALLSAKTQLSRASAAQELSEGPVASRKKSNFDIETGECVKQKRPRLTVSIFLMPLWSPWNPFIQGWTHFVLFLDLTYTAFLVPILCGFKVSDVDWGWGCIIDFMAGAMYTIEWILQFHIGFIGKNNSRRKLVMDGGAIAWYYVTKGHFFIDTLTVLVWIAQIIFIILHSTIGLEGGTVTDVYQAVRVLRLVRFTSLLRRLYATAAAAQSSLFPGLHVDNNTANFFNLLFGGAVLTNFLSCVWNFTAIAENFEETWVNYYSVFVRKYAADSSASSLTAEEAGSIPGPHRWLVGTYYILVTIGTVGYGDIYPQSVVEEIIGMIIIAIGLVFFGIILGSIAEALQRLSQDAKQAILFRGRMEAVEKWMSQRHLPQKLRNKISNFYAEDWLYGADAGEEVQVMNELPQGLRKEITLSLNVPLFKKLNFLQGFPESMLSSIASHMAPLQLPAGFELCEEGDIADTLWILHDGDLAAISFEDPDHNTVLKAPALVGEVAVLQEQNPDHLLRHFTYRTNTSCLLWEVPLKELLGLLRQNPSLYELLCRQTLPNHPFDYFAIDPKQAFTTEDGRSTASAIRNATAYKELDEDSRVAQDRLPQMSALSSRSSQAITRGELKRSEIMRAKSSR